MTSLWIVCILVYFVYYFDMSPFLTLLLNLVALLVFLSLGITGTIFGIMQRSRILLAVTLAMGTISILGGLTPFGTTFSAWCKLSREKEKYQVVIDKLAAGADKTSVGHSVIVDDGPTLRVAFVWDGLIDNWYGAIYDPSGEVMKANTRKSSGSSSRVRQLFGGELIRARHLGGDWYFCGFT
jgi:hypothetical protein